MSQEPSFAGVPQLSLRSILLGMLGSCIITASSMYVALKISALPWPTIFVAVLSMALLKALGKTSLNEINVTQTAMSSGAMVAGGLAFTLPGLWITGVWHGPDLLQQHFWPVLAVSLVGMLLGTILTWVLRYRFIEQEALPYPIGTAAAETIAAGDAGGKRSIVLFSSMGLSAIFTYLRDGLAWIPGTLVSKALYANNLFLGIWLSPMAMGMGYLLGTLYTGIWFLGAILAYGLIIPFGPKLNLFPSVQAAIDFKNTFGIGLMVGTGVGIFGSYLISLFKKIKEKRQVAKNNLVKTDKSLGRILMAGAFVISFVLSIAFGLSPLVSLLLMLGVLAASAMSATITGETGINPMEIFGIIVLLAIRLVVEVETTQAFFIAAVVAVACGYAGDMLNDYKTGHIMGTNPVAQMISQIAGGLVGTVVAVLAMFAIIRQHGGVGPETGLSAGQAFAVSQMVEGIGAPEVFAIALIIGALLYLLKVPAMTLGIGMYLPFEISIAIFIGGLIRLIVDKFQPNKVEAGTVTASGLLGGEGITGVAMAIFKMVTGG